MTSIPAQYFKPFGVQFDLVHGVMENPARHKVTKASAMRGYYVNEEAIEKIIREENDPVHYEVFEQDVPEIYGHVLFCISKLQPGRVGDEYFMTKGHYHTILETGELYLCLAGQGYMMMKTPDGECAWEEFRPGRMVYVPPFWAHRSVNTGNEPLISLCSYQADAGHNYGDIVKQGFPKRIFSRDGKVVVE